MRIPKKHRDIIKRALEYYLDNRVLAERDRVVKEHNLDSPYARERREGAEVYPMEWVNSQIHKVFGVLDHKELSETFTGYCFTHKDPGAIYE